MELSWEKHQLVRSAVNAKGAGVCVSLLYCLPTWGFFQTGDRVLPLALSQSPENNLPLETWAQAQ